MRSQAKIKTLPQPLPVCLLFTYLTLYGTGVAIMQLAFISVFEKAITVVSHVDIEKVHRTLISRATKLGILINTYRLNSDN